jgi:hypothetical protein
MLFTYCITHVGSGLSISRAIVVGVGGDIDCSESLARFGRCCCVLG